VSRNSGSRNKKGLYRKPTPRNARGGNPNNNGQIRRSERCAGRDLGLFLLIQSGKWRLHCGDDSGKHSPSNITIAGHKALVSYGGQPMTYYRCHETGRFHQACPMRQRTGAIGHTATATTWTDIPAQGAGGTQRGRESVDEGERRRIHTVREERESEKKRGIHTEEQKS